MAANAVQQQLVLYNNLLGSRASHSFYPSDGCCTGRHPALHRAPAGKDPTNVAPRQALPGPTAISYRASRAPHTTTQHPTFYLRQPWKLGSFAKPEARQGSIGSCA